MSCTFLVPAKYIRAAILHAAENDIRYYLNGIHFEPKAIGINIVSTDGNRMFFSTLPNSTCSEAITVPHQLFAHIKANAEVVKISFDPTTHAVGVSWRKKNSINFEPEMKGETLDGKFPSYRELFHRHKVDNEAKAKDFYVNPSFALDAAKSLSYLAEDKNLTLVSQVTNADSVYYTRSDIKNAMILVMGVNKNRNNYVEADVSAIQELLC